MIHSAWLGLPRCWQGTKTNRKEELSVEDENQTSNKVLGVREV